MSSTAGNQYGLLDLYKINICEWEFHLKFFCNIQILVYWWADYVCAYAFHNCYCNNLIIVKATQYLSYTHSLSRSHTHTQFTLNIIVTGEGTLASQQCLSITYHTIVEDCWCYWRNIWQNFYFVNFLFLQIIKWK